LRTCARYSSGIRKDRKRAQEKPNNLEISNRRKNKLDSNSGVIDNMVAGFVQDNMHDFLYKLYKGK
jgi:hypothetical protein